ncbi:MAG: T9SS type A sorting domain-containing protein [Candidatus Cloacimonetes bacterium]|nr:T9SS type A sorting domain-containing protein [Candidatus Cloacimonadota bacterium]
MKVLLIMFLIANFCLLAGDPQFGIWNNIRNSSYTEENDMHIRCETIDLPGLEISLYHLAGGNWEESLMVTLQGLTQEAVVQVDPEETQYFRFRTEHDTLVAMMPAYINNDIFPPSFDLISIVADDPAGDTLMAYHPVLDITETYFGYSDTRFYAALQNTTGEYPTFNLIPLQYYIYIAGILNPENVLVDSVAYAMIYASIPFVLSSGLYKISGTELNFDMLTQIGGIEHTVSDGKLLLACDRETLTGDEDFGEWPNLSYSLGVDIFTALYVFPADLFLADMGKLSLQFIYQYIVESFVNSLPTIVDYEMEISPGSTDLTVAYYDFNSNFPLIREVETDTEIYQLLPLSFDYSDTVDFATEITTDWDEMVIRFSDNGYEFTEMVIQNTEQENHMITTGLSAKNYPNPFNPVTSIDFFLPVSGRVNLSIYDVRGKLSAILLDEVLQTGGHSVVWNAWQHDSGIYIYKLKTSSGTRSGKMIMLK